MRTIAICGIGVCAPGLRDWREARDVLRGTAPHEPLPIPRLAASSLPSTERRRANAMSQLAMHVAAEAVQGLPGDMIAQVPTVFSSADGDGQVLAQLLEALAQPSIALSPTLFHNSVFNAPGGYWSIATRCEAAATTLCAGDASFAAGLLEAFTEVITRNGPVLHVAFDGSFPASLHAFGLERETFACALLLAPADDANGAHPDEAEVANKDDEKVANNGRLRGWTISVPGGPGKAAHTAIGDFFEGNATASALPLLAAIARREPAHIALPYFDDTALELVYTP